MKYYYNIRIKKPALGVFVDFYRKQIKKTDDIDNVIYRIKIVLYFSKLIHIMYVMIGINDQNNSY
ncbi:hypothetical protein PROVRETT_05942 [Providencia rettgeri DSM 1131]|nr:hypothetical protein PROVRETT_05942 [Providencia rettgeri DSM 1131]